MSLRLQTDPSGFERCFGFSATLLISIIIAGIFILCLREVLHGKLLRNI